MVSDRACQLQLHECRQRSITGFLMEISPGYAFQRHPDGCSHSARPVRVSRRHRFGCLFVASGHAGCDWAGHRWVEFSHSRVVCLNGEYPFSHARVQKSAICLVGLSGINSCRPAANARTHQRLIRKSGTITHRITVTMSGRSPSQTNIGEHKQWKRGLWLSKTSR